MLEEWPSQRDSHQAALHRAERAELMYKEFPQQIHFTEKPAAAAFVDDDTIESLGYETGHSSGIAEVSYKNIRFKKCINSAN